MTFRTNAYAALRSIFLAGLLCLPFSLSAYPAETLDTISAQMSPRVLFVVSGGFWTQEAAPQSSEDADDEAKPANSRGYYRAIALRSRDNTSRLYLQRIQLAEGGPRILDTREVEGLTQMRAYITDVRPESSSGVADGPGFAAFVYLKDDPASAEPDTYELFVDDFGDVVFAPASN